MPDVTAHGRAGRGRGRPALLRPGRHAAPTRGWLSGGSLAAGGAASLTVGAVLGGALAGVPNLLSPPSVAGPASHTGSDPVASPGPVALTATRAARVEDASAPTRATPARQGSGATPS